MNTPKTGECCTCKRGIMRDNCPTCEGSGMVIDFKAIRKSWCAVIGCPCRNRPDDKKGE